MRWYIPDREIGRLLVRVLTSAQQYGSTHDLLEAELVGRVVPDLERPRLLFSRDEDEEAGALDVRLDPQEVGPNTRG